MKMLQKKGDITIDKLKGFNGSYFSIYHDNPLDWDWYVNEIDVEDINPYLFPLSSMTEEQKMFLRQQNWCIAVSTSGTIETTIEGFDWLNKNHFDYRGLIPMGLANNAVGLNIY